MQSSNLKMSAKGLDFRVKALKVKPCGSSVTGATVHFEDERKGFFFEGEPLRKIRANHSIAFMLLGDVTAPSL